MSNVCNTKIVYYGSKDSIEKLRRDINRMSIENFNLGPFGIKWLGKLLLISGYSEKEIERIGSCKSGLENVYIGDDKGHIILTLVEKWSSQIELFEELKVIYELDYVFFSETENNDIYINTDIEGRYFPERILMKIDKEQLSLGKGSHSFKDIELDDVYDKYYFNNLGALKTTLKKLGFMEIEKLENSIEVFRDYMKETTNGAVQIFEFKEKMTI